MAKAKVAIVDDHRDTRAMLKLALEEWYAVDTYDTAREAFEGFKKDRPDVVIADMLLSDSHGLELGTWMRADPILRNVPVIAVSGMPYDPATLPMEVIKFVQKPVNIEELARTIDIVLHQGSKQSA